MSDPAYDNQAPQEQPQQQAPEGQAVPVYEQPEAETPQAPVASESVAAQPALSEQEALYEAPELETPAQAASDNEWQDEDVSNFRPVPRVAIQAFCESESVANTIDYASRDRRMAKAHLKVQLGGVNAAVEFYQTATTPNLILVESRLIGEELMTELAKLADVCDEGTNVVVIGFKNDVALYRDLISRGVAEYLVAPISMGDIMGVITTLFVDPDSAPLGNTIAFIGSKGGVGSSTIAHNVAWAISSNYESDVVLADLDLAFGTANIDFDRDPAQGVAEAVFSSDRIDETFLDRLLEKCTDHLSLLAAPSTLDREYDFDADDFTQLLDVAQKGTPNVIVDLPHIWTGWVRKTLASADKVVITATPDLASLRNTKNLIDTLAELRPNDGKPYLVLNQCDVPKRPEISIEEFTQPLDMQPSIIIPFDPALFGLASNNGQMISETDSKSEIAATFDTFAQILTDRREIEAPSKKTMGSILSKLSRKKSK
ncbi:MAG: CpaE family protein [Rhizobiaceae bacterium]